MHKIPSRLMIGSLIAVVGFVVLSAMTVPVGANEVRGQITNLGVPEITWNNVSFPGFYYDLDDNIGAEQLTFRLSDISANKDSATLSDQPDDNGSRGITYSTQAQPLGFSFAPWGQYDVIGFLGDEYFVAYDPAVISDATNADESVPYLYDMSKNRNLMTEDQISKILVDDDTEQTITSANPLKLEEDYQLAIKSVDMKGNKANLELSKNGQVVDNQVVQPSIANSKMKDQTYYYKTNIGGTGDIIQIAVHFKNAYANSDTSIATVDGEFQISDNVTSLNPSQRFGKMSIRTVNSTDMTITMDNKDNQITLSKKKDIPLMGKIHIMTADQDPIDAANPLRYYIYSEEPCS